MKRKKQINKLKDEEGIIQTKKEQIQNIIMNFYRYLYNTQPVDVGKIAQFLYQAKIPKVPEEYKKMMNAEITL